MGALAGEVLGSIYNTFATSNVQGDYDIGGLVGKLNGGSIRNSYATGNISNDGATNSPYNYYVGGLVGNLSGTGLISKSHATGTVTSEQNAGGLVGYAATTSGFIEKSYATGAVTATTNNAGGLVGYSTAAIERSYATGNVSGGLNIGGFVGRIGSSASDVIYAYSTGMVSGTDFTGGFVGNIGSSSIVESSYSKSSSVTGNDPGGFVGFATDTTYNPTLKGSYYDNSLMTNAVGGVSTLGGNASWAFISKADFATSSWNYRNGDTIPAWTYQSGTNSNYPMLIGVNDTKLYVRATDGGSSTYGDIPTITYGLYTSATNDGNSMLIDTVNPSGLISWTGTTPISTSNVGTYGLTYSSGLSLTSNVFSLNAGGSANWTVAPKSLDFTASKVYDGTVNFSSGTVSGTTANSDAMPTISSGSVTTASKNVDHYASLASNSLVLSNTNYTLTGGVVSADITEQAITISGLTASNKVYDGLMTVTTDSSSVIFGGIIGGDVLTVSSLSGLFENKNVGTGKTVTLSSLYGGADVANYTFIEQANTTADITAKAITLSGLSSTDKIYNGITDASVVNGTAVLQAAGAAGNGTSSDGISYSGDDISLNTTNFAANFNTKDVATANSVIFSGITLDGTDAGNYTLVQNASVSQSITKKDINVYGLTSVDKEYDGTASATVVGTATIQNETAGAGATSDGKVYTEDTITFNTGSIVASWGGVNVQTAPVTFSGYTLTGTDAGNYNLTSLGVVKSITPKALSLSGLAASAKIYDGLVAANISNFGTLSGFIGTETLTINTGSVSASFADKDAGTGKTVTATGYVLANGLNGGVTTNYSFSTSALNITADITAKAITVSGLTASDKIYDGLIAAMIDSSNVNFGGMITGDTLTVASLSGLFADKNVADGKIVSLTAAYGGVDVGNYTYTDQASTTANITKRDFAITETNILKIEGDADPALTYTFDTPLVAGDTLSGSLTREAGEGVGSYDIDSSGLSNPNYFLVSTTEGALTISPVLAPPAPVGAPPPPPEVNVFVAQTNNVSVTPSEPLLVVATAEPALSLEVASSESAAESAPSEVSVESEPAEVTSSEASSESATEEDTPSEVETVVVATSATSEPATSTEASAQTADSANSSGVSVSLESMPGTDQNGIVVVTLPKGTAASGEGFSFSLPKQLNEVAQDNNVPIEVTMASGDALPNWLEFDPETMSVKSGAVPAGAYPLEIAVSVGSDTFIVVISEKVTE